MVDYVNEYYCITYHHSGCANNCKEWLFARKPKININLNVIFGNVVLLAVIYMSIYFLFGYFVAWQFSDVRKFYSDTSAKDSFIQVMVGNIQNSHIIPFQLLRGVLFATFILPVVLMFRNKRYKLLISLILIYTTTAIVLIIPNFLFPDTVRWVYFVEIITSMTLFSVITWLVRQKRNPTIKGNNSTNKVVS